MKKLFLAMLLLPVMASAQELNLWHVLAEVSFRSEKDPAGYTVEKPVSSKHLRSFDGKSVKIKGYLIPLEETGNGGKYMLSSLPFNVCYFCGAAGPETVVQLETKEKLKFSTRQIRMEGVLSLNDKDPDNHIYILRSAKLVSP